MDKSASLKDLLGLLRRQLRIILASVILGLGIATLALLTITPIYTATALVMVDPSDKNLLSPDTEAVSLGSDNSRIDGEVELVRADTVLLMVIDRENLTADPEFASRPGLFGQLKALLRLGETTPPSGEMARLQTLEKLSAMVSAQRRGLTFLISVSARSEAPDKAARLANAVAGAYIDSQRSAKIASMLDARNMLLQQLDLARGAVTAAEASANKTPTAIGPDRPAPANHDLQQRAELARQQYDQLLARSQQLQAQAALQLADSRVVSEALRPGSPSWPNPRLLLVQGLLGGLAMGILAAFLHEQLQGGVTSEEQLAALAKSRLALAVPRIRKSQGQQSLADAITAAPLSNFAEAIRKIRTSVDHGLAINPADRRNRAQIVVLTSTAPGEGKTTLALAVARSYAIAGRHTLLIDCDLRHPALHLQLGLEPSDELTRALDAEDPTVNLQQALVNDPQTGLLSLIGSHSSSAATDQLITSRNFDRLLAAASRAFDVVVLDTPPLGTVVDGIYITRKADAVVMVAQWATTAQQDIVRALLSIEPALTAGALLLPVLNQQRIPTIFRYRRNRRSYRE